MYMKKNDVAINVDKVYKSFNVYLDKSNTIKESLVSLFRRNRKEKRVVLNDISLTIKKGEAVA